MLQEGWATQWSFLRQHTAQFNVPNATGGGPSSCRSFARSAPSEPLLSKGVDALWEFKVARSRNVWSFSLIAASVLVAALVIALLVGGEISGPRVAFVGAPPIAVQSTLFQLD
jgi:hypothetical protein